LVGGSIPLAPATKIKFKIKMFLINFLKDVIEESKKLTFPQWKETYVTTITIFITIIIFAITILLADFIISKVIRLIFGL
jgi:preprotein translocase SecE subunit